MDILYLDAFERRFIDMDDLKPIQTSFVGVSRESVQVKGYITLKTWKLRLYNMIIGWPSFNQLESTL